MPKKLQKRNARANLPERHEKLEEFVKHFSCYFRMAKSCLAPICKCSAQNQEKGMEGWVLKAQCLPVMVCNETDDLERWNKFHLRLEQNGMSSI